TMILRRSSRTDPRLVLGSALALGLPLGADLTALAQNPTHQQPAAVPYLPTVQVPSPAPPPPQSDANALKRQDQELDAARAAQRDAAGAQAKLRREIESLGDDRRALNQQLIDTAARVRDVEASI